MQKNNRSPAPHLVNPGRLPLTTDPQTAPPLQEGTQSFVEVDAAANTVSLERKKPREPAPPPADTAYPEPQKGAEGRIRRLGVQNCDGFCDPTRTLYPKAPANFEASRSESDLPPSVRFSCSLKTHARGGRPNCRKRIAPRLPTSLTQGRCRMPLTPNRTAPAGGHPVVRGG